MQINVENPILQTLIFSAIFFLLLIFSIRKIEGTSFFPKKLTQELKGFAILTIIFSHIGYFLSTNHLFLYPLSMLAGVGVNLFLFLSGFGLTIAHIKHPVSIISFYVHRLPKLFFPIWIVLIFLVFLDFVILGKAYSTAILMQSFLGFFPSSSIYESLDSPLWYFTLILFYYLIFPLIFIRRANFWLVLLLFLISFLAVKLPLPFDEEVINLYRLHFIAFPLGVLFATATYKINKLNLKTYFFLLPLLLLLFIYTSFNSGIGQSQFIEQAVSLLTMFSAILFFLIKDFDFGLFKIFGKYSYEIYLIHWPIMYKYGLLFTFLPGFLAVLLYLVIFLLLGWLIQKLVNMFKPNLLL